MRSSNSRRASRLARCHCRQPLSARRVRGDPVERENLEHLIRAAADVTHEYEFIIVGSQSILGAVPYPPAELKMSMEADMYPRNAPEKSSLIEGALGEGSRFHDTHRYYAQGVGPETATLPAGWEERLNKVQNEATDLKVGYCLSLLDVFLSKAYANREKDREFNMALLRYRYVETRHALEMVAQMPIDEKSKAALRARIRRWTRMLKERGFDFVGE